MLYLVFAGMLEKNNVCFFQYQDTLKFVMSVSFQFLHPVSKIDIFSIGKANIPAKTKHLYNIVQRLRRWSNIVQMLYKCFVFTDRSRPHQGH